MAFLQVIGISIYSMICNFSTGYQRTIEPKYKKKQRGTTKYFKRVTMVRITCVSTLKGIFLIKNFVLLVAPKRAVLCVCSFVTSYHELRD